MHDPIPAFNYFNLGETVAHLRNPRWATVEDYVRHVDYFRTNLDSLGLSNTAVAASALAGLEIPHIRGQITDMARRQLDSMLNPIYKALTHETNVRLTVQLKTSEVSNKLRSLEDKLTLTDTQKYLRAETVRCIETDAFRAGAVMGWNLAYDYVRHWMWCDTTRQSHFNTALMARTHRNGNPIYPNGFQSYEDFYSVAPILSERQALDIMQEAQLLPRVHGRLVHQLDERNRYAHANSLVPSADQIRRYIDDLIDIISNAPF